MDITKIKIGQAILFSKKTGNSGVFIKINKDLFFDAMFVDKNGKWEPMKSNFAYHTSQMKFAGLKQKIVSLNLIDKERIRNAMIYIFEKNKA